MKAIFKIQRSDYLSNATIGKEYKIIDIREGIFDGDYYVIFNGDDGKETTCYSWRFDISDEEC